MGGGTLPTGPDVPVGFEGERGRLVGVRVGALARLHVPSGDLQPVSSSGSRQEHLSLGGSFVQQTELRPGTPWWRSEMVETNRISVALALLVGKYR